MPPTKKKQRVGAAPPPPPPPPVPRPKRKTRATEDNQPMPRGGLKGNACVVTCWDIEWTPERCCEPNVGGQYQLEFTDKGIPHFQIFAQASERLSGKAHGVSLGFPPMRAGSKGGVAWTEVAVGDVASNRTYCGSYHSFCHKHHQGDNEGMADAPFPFPINYKYVASDHVDCMYRKPGITKGTTPLVSAYTEKRGVAPTRFWGRPIIEGSGKHRSMKQKEGAAEIRAMVKAGASFQTVLGTDFAVRSFNYCRLIHRYVSPSRFWRAYNIWQHGRTGVFKTKAAMAVARKKTYLHANYASRFFVGYDGEDILLLDDFSGQFEWKWLLHILDGYSCWLENKGGEVQLTNLVTIITSSMTPQQAYSNHIGDPADHIDQLMRRLDLIIDMDKASLDEKKDHVDHIRIKLNEKKEERARGPQPDDLFGEWDGEGSPPLTRAALAARDAEEQASSSNRVLPQADQYSFSSDHLEPEEDMFFRPNEQGENVGNTLLPRDIVHPSQRVPSPASTEVEPSYAAREELSDGYRSVRDSELATDSESGDDTMDAETLAFGYTSDSS